MCRVGQSERWEGRERPGVQSRTIREVGGEREWWSAEQDHQVSEGGEREGWGAEQDCQVSEGEERGLVCRAGPSGE